MQEYEAPLHAARAAFAIFHHGSLARKLLLAPTLAHGDAGLRRDQSECMTPLPVWYRVLLVSAPLLKVGASDCLRCGLLISQGWE